MRQNHRNALSNHLAPPPGLRVMSPWHHAAVDALARTNNANRRILPRRHVDEGDSALRLLAASTCVSRREALSRVFGNGAVGENAVLWGQE